MISIPGLSFFSAALIKTEISDISRFKNFNSLCSYAGLAPRVHQSANTTRNGPLSKNRCKNLQWILIETAIHFIHAMPEIAKKHERIKNRKGYNTAKVATARDMLKAVYHVLKEHRPFFIKKNNFIRTHAAPALSRV
ncbi:MAG: IS110 family transposase [Candidatus Omnitrophica bacterium]|nr:IS110 family transposase [Candidatus Omnitrophota bacterium]